MCMAGVLSAFPLAAGAAEFDSFSIGAWHGGAYSNDQSGVFSHCAAAATYASKLVLVVAVGRDYGWSIGVLNPDWKLEVGDTFPFDMTIDNGSGLNVSARAIDTNYVEMVMPGDSDVVDAFRYGKLLDVKGGDFGAEFDLSGTARLVAHLAQCVGDNLGVETAALAARAQPDGTGPQTRDTPASSSKLPTSSGPKSGTGMVISTSGDILTNEHVISGCDDITVRRDGQTPQPAQLLHTDSTNDLALLKIDGTFTSSEVARMRLSGVKAGETVAVYGFPLAGTLSDSGNIVDGNISSLSGLGNDVRLFQISAPIQPGNSGGPLLDKSGNVIGIVNAKLDELKLAATSGEFPQNVNFAIKANIAANFLDAHGIVYQEGANMPLTDLSDIADAARAFTVSIACQ